MAERHDAGRASAIRTGQKIQIPAQTGVRFSAGSAFKAAVSGGKAKERGR